MCSSATAAATASLSASSSATVLRGSPESAAAVEMQQQGTWFDIGEGQDKFVGEVELISCD